MSKISEEDRLQHCETLYRMFPKKTGKARGMAKLKTLLKDEAMLMLFTQALNNYKRIIEQDKTDPQYILMFSTFVNGRWEDYTNENLGLKPPAEEREAKRAEWGF